MYYDIAEREFESKNSNLSEIDSLSKEEIKIRLKDKLQKLDRDMAEIRLLLGGFLNRKKITPLRQARETHVCANLLRKRNTLIKYHFDTVQYKIMLKKIKIL